MENEAKPLAEVREELSKAQEALTDALRKANSVAAGLVSASNKQQEELQAIQARYDALKALTAGQEGPAKTYRNILNERS